MPKKPHFIFRWLWCHSVFQQSQVSVSNSTIWEIHTRTWTENGQGNFSLIGIEWSLVPWKVVKRKSRRKNLADASSRTSPWTKQPEQSFCRRETLNGTWGCWKGALGPKANVSILNSTYNNKHTWQCFTVSSLFFFPKQHCWGTGERVHQPTGERRRRLPCPRSLRKGISPRPTSNRDHKLGMSPTNTHTHPDHPTAPSLRCLSPPESPWHWNSRWEPEKAAPSGKDDAGISARISEASTPSTFQSSAIIN